MAHHAKAAHKHDATRAIEFKTMQSGQNAETNQQRKQAKDVLQTDVVKENHAENVTAATESEGISWQFYFVMGVIGIGVLLLIIKVLAAQFFGQ